MGGLIDKTKGAANEAIGKAKVAIGKETENPELIIEGAGQRAKGQVQKIVGKAKGTLGDSI